LSVETQTHVDLDSCAREPIERPGSIQPYGVLLACSLSTWAVTHISSNASSMLQGGGDLIGTPLDQVFSDQVVHDLRNALQGSMVSGAAEVLADVKLANGDLVDFSVHLSHQHVILEMIPQVGGRTSTNTPVVLVRSMMGRLKRAPTLERALALSANQIRAVTGFDRVMVYKFLEDGAGEVVAEALRAGLTPFLKLRYPSSDIPAQARKLYLQQWLRLIPDVNYEPSVLVGNSVELDLSLATLRSVSPIHLEYLRNMGSGATLTLSLITGDRLWGLIACHHEVPRRPSVWTCNACELFAQIVSLQVEAKEQERELGSIARSREVHERLIASMPPEETLFDNLARYTDLLRELIACDGIAVWTSGVLSGFGNLPPVEDMPALVGFLNEQEAQEVYITESLGTAFPPAVAYRDVVSGLIAVPFSRQPRDYLLFFRREILQVINWGGDPNKPVEHREGSDRIGPRRSFAAWREEVSGSCTPWLAIERKIAESLRTSLLDVILRRADLVERERRSAQESQALLIAELNHRVKNILALIRSLVRQSRKGARSIKAFTQDLEQRIESLARAHDQITQGAWTSAPLRRLLAAEAQVWTSASREGLAFTGPEVLLDARSFQTMALVFHELMTNAAKYGALSVSTGTLAVSWTLRPEGGVEILWQEAGGPPVKPPSRRGFGSVVVEQTVPFELQGEAQVDYLVGGVRARFVIPSTHVSLGREAEETTEAVERIEPADLTGKRLLLVEDSMMIALDAQATLQDAAINVEIAGAVADAMRAVELERFDAAVLDINLSGETSFGVADRCAGRRMPFVFATGYGENVVIPDRFKGVPIVAKPYDVGTLRAALARAAAIGSEL
jgi:light-regulated signal transduction histidine kinase (bacteriophytochrome)